jgi:MFS transporter, DHA1 family, multidrug resistance protein
MSWVNEQLELIRGNQAYAPTTNYDAREKDSQTSPLDPFSQNMWRLRQSIHLLCWLSFVSYVGQSSIVPIVWFRVLSFQDSSPALVGLSISLHFFGHMIGSTLCLSLYKKYPDKARFFLMSAFLVIATGDLLFFFAPEIWVIFIARFLSGLGAGGQDMIQEYVFVMSQFDRRSRAVTNLGILAAASLVIGPLLTTILSLIFDYSTPNRSTVTLLTLPGLISASFSFGCFVILAFFEISSSKVEEDLRITTFDTSEPLQLVPSSPLLFVVILMYFLAFMGSPSFETMVVPFTLTCYSWKVMANSLFFAIAGITSVFALIILEILSEFVSEYYIFIPSLGVMGIGYLLLVPFNSTSSECAVNHSSNENIVGCECFADQNTGENHFTPMWRFITGCILIVVSNSFSFQSIGRCFSKILYWMKPNEIERRISVFKNAGCVAEIIGPLWMSISLESLGNSQTFILLAIFPLIACLLGLVLAPRIKRLSESLAGRNVTYAFINDRKHKTPPSPSTLQM